MTSAQEVLDFWNSIGPKGWWMKDNDVDQKIIEDFSELHTAAANGGLSDWENAPDSCLALVLVLDQFSRNMFRGDLKTFASDAKALSIARRGVDKRYDDHCNVDLRGFYYLPYMHSESLEDQNDCVRLMHAHSGKESLDAALEHREIIQRFSRFPHRNGVLGRHTTPSEQAFLDAGGFKG